jgi:transposase
MDRIDVRQLERAAREQMRRIVVRLHERGRSQAYIAEELGLRAATVCAWVKRAAGGETGFGEAQRGRSVGQGRRLSAAQEQRIQADLLDSTPERWKLPYALWSGQAVRALIRHHFVLLLPIRTVRHYLKRWGLTPQRPLRRAYEQKPAVVARWLKEAFPALVVRAQHEGGTIHWGDETAVASIEHYPRGYAPVGQTPVLVLKQAQRQRLNILSAITHQGLLRFMLYRETLTAQVLIRFLKRLIRESGKKVFLVLDNLRVHHAQRVRQWVAARRAQIELCFLPSYAPELNPDEYLNADLKARLHAAEPVRDAAHLKRKVLSHLRSLQKQPARIKSYFQHENIRYAA